MGPTYGVTDQRIGTVQSPFAFAEQLLSAPSSSTTNKQWC